jgi:hypothetical protein
VKKRKPRQKKKPRYTEKQIAGIKAHALKLWKADDSHAKELGYALIQVRAALKYTHGSFKKWWQENKLSQARVSYCMRLAQGKVAAAKAKQRSAFQGSARITKKIKKDVNDFLAFVVQFDTQKDATPVYRKLVQLVGDMTINIGRLPGWKMRDTSHLHVELASRSFQKSLNHLMRCLFNEKTPDEASYDAEQKKAAESVSDQKASSATAD